MGWGEELRQTCVDLGVRLIGCQVRIDVFGFKNAKPAKLVKFLCVFCPLRGKKRKESKEPMPVLRIPTPLRTYTNGQSEVKVNGTNIAEALADLTAQYPAIKPHLFNENGSLRPFVNLFVGERNIRDLQGMNTPVTEGDRVMLIPSIAGGACHSEPDGAKQSPSNGEIVLSPCSLQ